MLYYAATDQPTGFHDNPHFQYFINNAFNPQYVPVSRNRTMSNLIRTFQKRRTELISELQNISFSIALTSDIRSIYSKQDYLCVIGHYVDTQWILQKKAPWFLCHGLFTHCTKYFSGYYVRYTRLWHS